MKQNFYKLLMAVIFASLCGFAVNAQIKQMADEKLTSEITMLRQKLVEAIERRDKKTLESLYAADFTHTHAFGAG